MDKSLLRTLNGLVDLPGVNQLCWLVDQAWSPVLLLALIVAVSLRQKRPLEIPGVLAAVVIADVLCARVIKPMFGRLRPCAEVDLEWVVAPFGCGSAFSMPSCHAANLFAVAMVINRPWGFAIAVVGSVARPIAGVHYPSDLLVGALIGLAIGWFVRLGLNSVDRTKRRKKLGKAGAPRPRMH